MFTFALIFPICETMMKIKFLSVGILLISISIAAEAQLSHGGKPLPFSRNLLRSSFSDNFYVEMPPFDAEQMMREDSINESAGLRQKRFAKKFVVNITPENAGTRVTTEDGTKVWRVGIRSKGAYSLNVLFSKYRVPEGAKVFLYNSDQSKILGAFTEKNNSEDNLLPTSPVSGEELIIEYQEPENAAFPGMLAIGEVNHAYAELKPVRPRDPANATCQHDPICWNDLDEQTQSVCMLIINGATYCTGSMVNNTAQDGTPYLLTSCHCLGWDKPAEEAAKTIVVFFNYQSPACNSGIRGIEEMSLVSPSLKASDKNLDMALLQLSEIPPPDFRPYYSGWNISDSPESAYTCIHQPNGGVKKVAQSDGALGIETNHVMDAINFLELWRVKEWSVGITEGGSSGSQLLDNEKRIIGALTGGRSNCSSKIDDYFWTLKKAWELYPEPKRQLKHWLDPLNTGTTQLNGLNPYHSDSFCLRISNMARNEGYENYSLKAPESGFMFGYNSLETNEYAEKFEPAKPCLLYGVSLVTPGIDTVLNKKIMLNVYADGVLVKETEFRPKYESYASPDNFFETVKPFNKNGESYLRFEEPIQIWNEFFISYRLDYSVKKPFQVYSAAARKTGINTAYYRENNAWIPVSAHVNNPMNTSLWINPVIKYFSGTDIIDQISDTKNAVLVYKDKSDAFHVKSDVFLENARINIWSISGTQVYSSCFSGSNHTFYLDKSAKGVYVLTLQNQFGETLSREKIIY